ncbi:MAG: HAMP domain-containing histidine kinase, partial [candidate division Zixibacteria bacterium]|nr:HAMP domain-containing histidine kinase [candidate division Zixibacteria bacterium]
QKSNFPIIITDPDDEPQFWKEVGIASGDTTAKAQKKLRNLLVDMDSSHEPIPIYFGEEEQRIIHFLHFGDPPVVKQLRWMPFIEGTVVAVFIWIAILVFRNIKRSEQRSIWVGMAKETAHQLGTPLSSLLGWLELIKMKFIGSPLFSDESENGGLPDITKKMLNDVKRLERIANRFGQIGSKPELKQSSINNVIRDVIEYYSQRIPNQGKGIELKGVYGEEVPVNINVELISWVIENLIKNSLEAINPIKGTITIKTSPSKENNFINITVADNGRGIPARQQKRIFYPGFTTKKRGWGLGLTLARRIVEEYHKGKIRLVESVPNRNTVIEIIIPTT